MRNQSIIRLTIFLGVLLITGGYAYLLNRSPRLPATAVTNSPQASATSLAPTTGPVPTGPTATENLPESFLSTTLPIAQSTALPIPRPAPSEIRAIRADYKDMSASREQAKPLETSVREAGFNLVSLGAGRAE
jgi:hypothetical protein